ncbi:MAG: hypothetical protein K2P58_02545 [Hyphomonadaceae bacterium]|nr:hypothetical protein [Hyphomonadaceae bacterium]
MRILYSLFDNPEDVAAQHTLTLKPYQLMASWLRVGEALLRRLLLIEASAYPKPNPPPLLRKPRRRVRKELSFWPDKPEAWRVSFRCFSAVTLRHAQRDALGGSANFNSISLSLSTARRRGSRFRSAWPLAERYEALVRVFNNPAAYARRLAARLHATPHRVAEVLKTPPEAEHRVENYAELTETAATHAKRFNSS